MINSIDKHKYSPQIFTLQATTTNTKLFNGFGKLLNPTPTTSAYAYFNLSPVLQVFLMRVSLLWEEVMDLESFALRNSAKLLLCLVLTLVSIVWIYLRTLVLRCYWRSWALRLRRPLPLGSNRQLHICTANTLYTFTNERFVKYESTPFFISTLTSHMTFIHFLLHSLLSTNYISLHILGMVLLTICILLLLIYM